MIQIAAVNSNVLVPVVMVDSTDPKLPNESLAVGDVTVTFWRPNGTSGTAAKTGWIHRDEGLYSFTLETAEIGSTTGLFLFVVTAASTLTFRGALQLTTNGLLSIANVQTALTNQGYTSDRAPGLDNLDAAISTRATQAQILSDATPFAGADIAAIVAAVAALNDLSIADVQTALTNQGYSSDRALLLDNLDATVASVLSAVAALNDLSIADVQTALTNQNYTPARALLLDNLDALISSRAIAGDEMALTAATLTAIQALVIADATPFDGADVAAIRATGLALSEYIQGGREIDFVGNDALGWQRIERDTSGVEVRRYNLFDGDDARITGTPSTFLATGKMISKEELV